jgi:hypothetical protein
MIMTQEYGGSNTTIHYLLQTCQQYLSLASGCLAWFGLDIGCLSQHDVPPHGTSPPRAVPSALPPHEGTAVHPTEEHCEIQGSAGDMPTGYIGWIWGGQANAQTGSLSFNPCSHRQWCKILQCNFFATNSSWESEDKYWELHKVLYIHILS